VQRIHPGFALVGDDGGDVALRCPITFVEHRAEFYDWNFAVDEVEILDQPYTNSPGTAEAVDAVDLTTGPGVDYVASGVIFPRIRFAFAPLGTGPGSNSPLGYQWEIKEGAGSYGSGGAIDANVRDGAGLVYGYTGALEQGQDYTIRVQSVYKKWVGGSNGQEQTFYSGWIESDEITTVTPSFDLDPPLAGAATGGVGQISLSWTTPNSADFVSLEIYVSTTNDVTDAAPLANIFSAQNTARTYVHSGLGAAATRFYFARSRGPAGAVSAWTASVTATTT
jgi:hypothetical protein